MYQDYVFNGYYCKSCKRYSVSYKKGKLCPRCREEKYRLYTTQRIVGSEIQHPDVCFIIDKIFPKEHRELKCHYVFMGEYVGHWGGVYKFKREELKPISHWNDIWDHCDWIFESKWVSKKKYENLIKKFNGKLARGILWKHGNGIHVVVKDRKGDMYRIMVDWS